MTGTIVTWERAVTITCDTHGPMTLRPGHHWWQCAGFDGEGCTVGYDGTVYSGDAFQGRVPGITITGARP